MKTLNLLNRGVRVMFSAVEILLKICGLSTFIYKTKKGVFRRQPLLKTYAYVLFVFGVLVFGMSWYVAMNPKYPYHRKPIEELQGTVKVYICLFARFHQIIYQQEIITLLNEYLILVKDLCILARHPNLFRFSHFLLILFAFQSMFRSWSSVYLLLDRRNMPYFINFIITWMHFLLYCVFNLAMTMMMLLFIALIACYDELHRCTRRISEDVRILRLSQVMTSGQRMVLIAQLRGHLEQLIELRGRMFHTTVRLMKLFRFHLLMAVLYWLGHILMIFCENNDFITTASFYQILVGLSNLAFYFTIFQYFVWVSKLSRSFWSFHIVNYDQEFDQTVDTLLHRELFENIKVTTYGIPLDMNLFFRFLNLIFLYVVVLFVCKKV